MQSDEQEIRQLVTNWMEASKAGDADKVLSLMADDVVFLVTGQPPMIGKSAFAAALHGQQVKRDLASMARAKFKRSRSSETGRICGLN